MTQTTQPVGRFAQARALYGRSTMAQLVIFVGLELAGAALLYGIDLLINIFFGLSMMFGYVWSFLSIAVAIGLIFLHRSVTFRSADRAACTALPLAGLVLLMNVMSVLSALVMNSTGLTIAMVDWLSAERAMLQVIATYAGAWLVSLASGILILFALAGAVRLARTKGRRVLCILPILALAPLAFLNLAATWSMNWSMNGPMWFTLVSIALSLIMQVVTAVCGYFAQRNLIYRDTCDTAPAARQYILRCMQEVQSAEALVQPRSAGPVQPELTASAKIRVPDTAEGSGKYRTDANDAPGGNA